MSTKTTFKRIALVAVASLGLGVITSVAPANAAVAFTTTTTPTVGTSSQYVTTGGTASTTIGFTAAAAASGDTWSGATVSISVPTGSAVTLTDSDGAGTDAFVTTGVTTGLGAAVSATTGAITGTTSGAITAGAVIAGTITITPDVVGLYKVTVTAGDSTTKVASIWYKPTSATVAPSGGTTNVWGTAATASGIADGTRFIKMLVYAGTSDTAYLVSSAGVGSLYGTVDSSTVASSPVVEYTSGTNAAGGFGIAKATSVAASASTFVANDRFAVYATSGAVGTQTITITPTNGTTAARTLTITWGAAAVVSAQYSTSRISTSADATADDVSRSYATTAGTKRAIVTVTLNSAAATAITGQSIAVSISGPGSLALDTGNTATTPSGRSLSVTGTTGSASKYYVHVFSDGTAGAATITITSGTTTIATETLTFVGSPTKATVTQNLYIAKAATQLGANPDATALVNDGTTVALTPALYVDVTDAAGNAVVAGSTVRMVSSVTTVITAGACVEYTDYPGSFECSVNGASGALSGQTATITVEVLNPVTAKYDIVATPVTFAIGGAIATTTISLDSNSYAPGQALALSAVAVDSSGNKAYDGQAPYISLSSNKAVGGALPAATKQIKDGKYVTSLTTPSLYAPALAGEFRISGKTAATVAAPAGATFLVTATVEDANLTAAADAAAEATDAANAATDAANAAAEAADAATAAAQDAADAVAALSASVTTMMDALKKQITSLTNLIIKIQKKVKA
jgi:trimeric autotransporter adhesin